MPYDPKDYTAEKLKIRAMIKKRVIKAVLDYEKKGLNLYEMAGILESVSIELEQQDRHRRKQKE